MKRSTPLKRTGPPERRSRLKRKSPLRSVNPERRAKERERAYGPPERREWLTSQPCVSCGALPRRDEPHHQHHVRGGGTGRKADYRWTVALCWQCHRRHHQGEWLDVAWEDEARRTEAAWQEHQRQQGT